MINIGAGGFQHEKWISIDKRSEHYRKVQNNIIEHDINEMSPLPFNSNSVSLAYTSHTIEHIKNPQISSLFKNVYKILKPGGIFRITCPNIDLYYNAVMIDDTSALRFRTNNWFYKKGIDDKQITPLDYLVKIAASRRGGRVLIENPVNDKRLVSPCVRIDVASIKN